MDNRKNIRIENIGVTKVPATPKEDDVEIIIPPGTEIKLRRGHTYLPYTHWQIKRILKALGMHLVEIGGYKCNRVPNYKQHYKLVKDDTGEIVRPDTTNEELRRIFAKADIPLDSQD